MGEDLFHLCSPSSQSGVIAVKILRKILKGRHRADDLFKCGSCNSTFETICHLHAHCMKHSSGGSYHFDSYTGTAYPKYDTACASTQWEGRGLAGPSLKPQSVTSFSNSKKERKSAISAKRKRKMEIFTTTVSISAPDSNNVSVFESTDDHAEKLDVLDATKTDTASLSNCLMLKIDGTEPDHDPPDVFAGTDPSGSVDTELLFDLNIPQGLGCMDGEELDQMQVDECSETNLAEIDLNKYDSPVGKMDRCSDDDFTNEALVIDELNAISSDAIIKTPADKPPSDILSECEDSRDTVTNDRQETFSHHNDEQTATEALLQIGQAHSNIKTKCNNTKVTKKVIGKNKKAIANIATEAGKKLESTKEGANKLVSVIEHAMNSVTDENRTAKDLVKKQRECGVCGKVGSAAMLTYHKYLHREKSSTCDKCGLQFQHPATLKTHRLQHQEKQFQCKLCPETFHRKQYLVTHMLAHTGVRPYMCDTCGKSYRDANNLNRHVRHTHNKLRNFECDICHEKFFRSDHLKSHRSRHFDATFKCSYCSKAFKSQPDLSRHTTTHTGDKQYQCRACKHGFTSIMPYYKHMLKTHNIGSDEAKKMNAKRREQAKTHLKQAEQIIKDTALSHNGSDQHADLTINDQTQSQITASSVRVQTVRESDSGNKAIHAPLLIKNKSKTCKISKKKKNNNDNATNRLNSRARLYKTIVGKKSKTYEGASGSESVEDEVGDSSSTLQEPCSVPDCDSVHTGGDSLLEYMHSDGADAHIQDSQIVVLGEEGNDLGILSQLDTDNVHVILDYKYAGEVVIDQC